MITKEQFLKVYYPPKKIINILLLIYSCVVKIIYLYLFFISIITLFFILLDYNFNWILISKLFIELFCLTFLLGVLNSVLVFINNKRIKHISNLLSIKSKLFSIYEKMYIKKC